MRHLCPEQQESVLPGAHPEGMVQVEAAEGRCAPLGARVRLILSSSAPLPPVILEF